MIVTRFIGIGLIGIMFGTNEYLYYIQVMKSVDGSALTSSTTGKSKVQHAFIDDTHVLSIITMSNLVVIISKLMPI